MFSENIEIIKDTFKSYMGESSFFILFIIALLYIFIKEQNSEVKTILLYFSCAVMLIVFNPLYNKITMKVVKGYIYWRNYWMIPFGIVIAYAATSLIKNTSNKPKKVTAFLVIIFIIIISGKNIYTQENYSKVNNWYKVPDEYLQVTNIISTINNTQKKAMIPTELVSYIRIIDPDIKLAYARIPTGNYDNPVLKAYLSGDIKTLVELCNKRDINIIIIKKDISLSEPLSKYGFEAYGETENYIIYYQNNNSK